MFPVFDFVHLAHVPIMLTLNMGKLKSPKNISITDFGARISHLLYDSFSSLRREMLFGENYIN